jgi:hypothetical protein
MGTDVGEPGHLCPFVSASLGTASGPPDRNPSAGPAEKVINRVLGWVSLQAPVLDSVAYMSQNL